MVPRVLTMRELRDRLSGVAGEVLAGGDVFAGSHRKPELVLMSVRRYQELTAAPERGDKPVSPPVAAVHSEVQR